MHRTVGGGSGVRGGREMRYTGEQVARKERNMLFSIGRGLSASIEIHIYLCVNVVNTHTHTRAVQYYTRVNRRRSRQCVQLLRLRRVHDVRGPVLIPKP